MTELVPREDRDLVTVDPFAGLLDLQAEFDRWRQRWRDLLSGDILPAGAFVPLADVEETEDAYVVEIELPGVDRRDIEVLTTGRRLTVTGERKEKERVGVLRRRTRRVGTFRYEIEFPGEIAEDEVTASLNDGVLTVRLPKPAAERPRKVTVS